MDKKIMLVSVIGFIAIITMIVISSSNGINTETDLTGNAIGGLDNKDGRDGSVAPVPKVYANACNADGICEIIELQVSEDANLGGNLLIEGNIFTKGITAWEGGWFGGNVFVNGTLANPTGKIVTGEVKIVPEIGEGIGYACIDNSGIIFKSNITCPQLN